MAFVSVLAAGVAAFMFGAVWYTLFGPKSVAASGVPRDETGNPANRRDPVPYVTSFLCAILVAGMMRHVFLSSGIDSIGGAAISGFGVGLFLVSPWIATHYAFAARPRELLLIDGGYATFGCTVIGLVLGLF